MTPQPLVCLGSSRDELRAFPPEARARAGFELHRVQLGLEPHDWKPMPSVGAGVREVRVHNRGEFRVLYIANRPEAVYVLHAFLKTSRKTARRDIETARKRLALVPNLKLVR